MFVNGPRLYLNLRHESSSPRLQLTAHATQLEILPKERTLRGMLLLAM